MQALRLLAEREQALVEVPEPPPPGDGEVQVRVRAIALNCGHLTAEEAADAVRAVQAETGIATADVLRDGPGPLLDALFA